MTGGRILPPDSSPRYEDHIRIPIEKQSHRAQLARWLKGKTPPPGIDHSRFALLQTAATDYLTLSELDGILGLLRS